MITRLLISCICLLITLSVSAQNEEHKTHEVKPGETVYGISKQYGVSAGSLQKLNPDIKDGLREGIILVIPFAENKLEGIDTTSQEDTTYIYHEVVAGETLFSLSKRYNFEIEEVKKLNPDLDDVLKLGRTLKIPKPSQENNSSGTPLPDDYHYHEIKPGETAYSLSKVYKMSLDSLYLLNPDAINGLQISQLLKFPKNRKKLVTTVVPEVAQTLPKDGLVKDENLVQREVSRNDSSAEGFSLYQIQAGDSFFSLKKKFNVSKERLVELNPELINGVSLDKYIIVPGEGGNVQKKEKEKASWLDKLFTKVDSSNAPKETWTVDTALTNKENQLVLIKNASDTLSNESFEIAILLPFNIPAEDSIINVMEDENNDEVGGDSDGMIEEEVKEPLSRTTQTAIEFYNGILVAADSLSKEGMNITLRIYDTKNDINIVLDHMDEIIKIQPDLVIGPLFKNNVEWVADKLKEFNIPVISPLSKNVSVLGHPNLIQCRSGDEEIANKTGEIINHYYKDANVIFTHTGDAKELRNIQLIKSHLMARSEDGFMSDVTFNDEMLKKNNFRDVLLEDKENVFVVCSDNKVFLSDLVNKLRQLRDTSISMIGPHKLIDMPTLEADYLDKLNIIMADPSFVNYQDSVTLNFILEYRERCGTEPSDYAFRGYDVGMIYLRKLWVSKQEFLKDLENDDLSSGLHSQYKMKKTENGGFKNQPVYTTGIRDLMLIKLD